MDPLKILEGKKILCVDDVEINLMVLSLSLENLGTTILTATSAVEALTKFSGTDLIITDIAMPQMSGHDLATKVREVDRNIPILEWTASGVPSTVQLKALFNGQLGKPFSKDDLVDTIFSTFKLESLYGGKYANVCLNTSTLVKDVPSFPQLAEKLKVSILGHFHELETVVEQKDEVTAHGLLHKMKGTSGMGGFSTLSQILAQVEHDYKSNSKHINSKCSMRFLSESMKIFESNQTVFAA